MIQLNERLEYKNTIQITNMPLWHNSKVKIDYRNQWDTKGYHILNDILNINGTLMTLTELQEKGLKVIFLEYARINKGVRALTLENYQKQTGPHLPRSLFEIGLLNKDCKRIYNKLMKYNTNVITIVEEKWEHVLNEEIPINIVEKSFKIYRQWKKVLTKNIYNLSYCIIEQLRMKNCLQ